MRIRKIRAPKFSTRNVRPHTRVSRKTGRVSMVKGSYKGKRIK
jgi:hypothetical protein